MNGSSSGGAWAELESDPGLFTLLLRDFGVQGVAVEEVYDLHSPLNERTYGFIFLFKWLEGARRGRRGSSFVETAASAISDAEPIEGIFFAKQMADNSCATYALLNILLNRDDVRLGPLLEDLKERTKGMNYTEKGSAIGVNVELAAAHNRHARYMMAEDVLKPSRGKRRRTSNGTRTVRADAFHFSSFVCVRERVFELDGLKQHPLDLGVVPAGLHWTEYFRRLMVARLFNEDSSGREIRYNLMGVVPCPLYEAEQLLMMLRDKLEVLWHVLESRTAAVMRKTRNASNEVSSKRSKMLKFLQSSAAPTALRRCACRNGCCISKCSFADQEAVMSQLLSDEMLADSSLCVPRILTLVRYAEAEIERLNESLKELRQSRRQYEVDDQRRVHDYEPFIRAFLTCLTRLEETEQQTER